MARVRSAQTYQGGRAHLHYGLGNEGGALQLKLEKKKADFTTDRQELEESWRRPSLGGRIQANVAGKEPKDKDRKKG